MRKLLVIDDDPGVSAYIKAAIQSQGEFAVSTAGDGFKGLDMALAEPPDVVLLDITMPGRDGLTVLRMLKEDERTSHVPVVMMTGVPTQEARTTSTELGAFAFMPKPFSPAKLREQLVEAATSRVAG
jgi:DNA-binding response OmpR family regulator